MVFYTAYILMIEGFYNFYTIFKFVILFFATLEKLFSFRVNFMGFSIKSEHNRTIHIVAMPVLIQLMHFPLNQLVMRYSTVIFFSNCLIRLNAKQLFLFIYFSLF